MVRKIRNISATKHRIELLEGSKTVYRPPYRAGHRKRDFEKADVGPMLADGVRVPSNA